jgi:hypothetical protein
LGSVQGDDARLRGIEAEAVVAATAALKSQFTLDLHHYSLYIDHHKTDIEVTFVPDQLREVGRDYGGVAGGATDYGPEVHYYVSRKTGKVTRHHFAR